MSSKSQNLEIWRCGKVFLGTDNCYHKCTFVNFVGDGKMHHRHYNEEVNVEQGTHRQYALNLNDK